MPDENGKRTRIQWTMEEQTKMAARAAQIRRTRTDLSLLDLLRKAMNEVLPSHRRRKIYVTNQVRWFESAVAEAERQALAAEKNAAIKEKVVEKRADVTENVLAVNSEIRELVREKVGIDHRMLREILAVRKILVVTCESLGIDLSKILMPVDETAPTMEANGQANGNGRVDDNGVQNLVNQPAPLPQARQDLRLKVAIVGAEPAQQKAIKEQIGQAVRLMFIDTREIGKQLPDADFLICTRHVTHTWTEMGKKVFGRDRTIFIGTTGVGAIVAKIHQLGRSAAARN